MKKTKKKVKMVHPGVIFKDETKEENLTLQEDKDVILEEEHDCTPNECGCTPNEDE